MRRLALLIGIAAACACTAPARADALPPVRHVFIVMLENKGYSDTFGPTGMVSAPYLSQTLPSMGQLLTRYYGTGHASLDNYIAMISGQPPTPQTKADCPDPLGDVPPDTVAPYGIAAGAGCVYPSNFLTIADQLTAAGLTWKGY